MGCAPADLSPIPVYQLTHRRLHLGPFGSGRDLGKFLGLATVGAIVAAVTSVVLWLPFLGVGAMVAFVRVEGRTLDDYALGYCRFRWRASAGPGGTPNGTSSGVGRPPLLGGVARAEVLAGGIPIAYLPPGDLQRLFEEWRSVLATMDRPFGCRMRGERFSPLPFLPAARSLPLAEGAALQSYRDLVRALLRDRYRRVVELTIGNDPSDRRPAPRELTAYLEELASALERLGIPARTRSAPDEGCRAPALGAAP